MGHLSLPMAALFSVWINRWVLMDLRLLTPRLITAPSSLHPPLRRAKMQPEEILHAEQMFKGNYSCC